MKVLPLALRHDLVLIFTDELDDILERTKKDSSQSLQLKCTLLYMLALLSSEEDEICLTLLGVTLPLLQDMTFITRFPIHEKYHSVLYFCLH